MKTIHILIAAALASSPLVARAQSTEPAPLPAEPAEEDQAVDAATVEETDIGSTGSGTGDIGSTGSGTGDIGSTGSGTGTIGSTGSGTGTLAAGIEPVASLHLRSTWMRTPGTMQVTVSLAAMPELDPAASASIAVPLASSSAECSVPASVTVAWTSASGGLATATVTCTRAPGQTVTLSSGTARASFTTK